VRQRPSRNADALADRREVLLQVLVASHEVGQQVAVQVDQIVALQLDRRVDVVLVRALRIELVAQERFEIVEPLDQVRPLAPQVMPGAHLQIPRVAHDRELEQSREVLVRQHLLGRDDARVPRQLRRDPVTGQVRQPMADPRRVVHRIAPAQRRQRRTHARAAGLGNVDEQEVVAVRQEHRDDSCCEGAIVP